jgi:L-amino acid N-acyltransferase YncA
MSDIRIRAATIRDAPTITSVYVDSWNQGFGDRMPAIEVDAERVERWKIDIGPTTATQWWVAENEGVIVGFVGIGPCRDPAEPGLGELDTIAVSPQHWDMGLGKSLMSVALQGLRAAGFTSASLWTLSNYPLGERFYVASGWSLNGATRDGGNQARYDHALDHFIACPQA